MNKVLNSVASVSIKSDHEFVMLEQRASVGYSEQSNLKLLSFIVKFSLYIHTHCAGTFV